jgi:hypothetical protein
MDMLGDRCEVWRYTQIRGKDAHHRLTWNGGPLHDPDNLNNNQGRRCRSPLPHPLNVGCPPVWTGSPRSPNVPQTF